MAKDGSSVGSMALGIPVAGIRVGMGVGPSGNNIGGPQPARPIKIREQNIKRMPNFRRDISVIS
jgi:hypothetical protein